MLRLPVLLFRETVLLTFRHNQELYFDCPIPAGTEPIGFCFLDFLTFFCFFFIGLNLSDRRIECWTLPAPTRVRPSLS